MGVGQKLTPPGSPKGEVQVPVPDILEPGTPERSRPGKVLLTPRLTVIMLNLAETEI